LVNVPAPPGQEGELAKLVIGVVESQGYQASLDAKGNVLVPVCPESDPKIVVTAHLDELALMVTAIYRDGSLQVAPLGGLHPSKWGETPVEILANSPIPGILSMGSVHTEDPASAMVRSRSKS